MSFYVPIPYLTNTELTNSFFTDLIIRTPSPHIIRAEVLYVMYEFVSGVPSHLSTLVNYTGRILLCVDVVV